MSNLIEAPIKRIAPVLSAIRDMLMRLFRRTERAPIVADVAPVLAFVPAAVEPAPPSQAAPTAPRASRKRTQEPVDHATFSDLLENLGASFDAMRVPEMKGSWLGKREVRAIHKLGVYVEQDWAIERHEQPRIPVGLTLPNIASCFMIHRKHQKKGWLSPRFAFAIKQPSLPVTVEQVKGTPYQFGECYEVPDEKTGKVSTFWMWAWLVVKDDGLICFPKERRQVVHHLIHRRRTNDASRRDSYTAKVWTAPAIIEDRDRPQHEVENWLAMVFRQLLVWWTARDASWSVGVRKDGRRVTFSIKPEHTAAYFADRNKVASSGAGQKKIIHYVREHERSNGSVVRAHVRGLREFDWLGYQCFVTAPKFTGDVFSAKFDLNPLDVPVGADEKQFLDLEQLAGHLAEAEDSDRRKVA